MEKRPSLILGGVLTFSGVVDAAISVIDHYSRWEVLVNLQERVPFLAHPATPVILLVVGLILIHRSLQSDFARAIAKAQSSALQDEHGKPLQVAVKPPSLRSTYLVICLGVVSAIAISAIWLLNYNPKPQAFAGRLAVPPICKTVDCFPPSPKPKLSHPAGVINSLNCPNGICAGHDVNGPVTVNPPANPNAPVVTYAYNGWRYTATPGGTHMDNIEAGSYEVMRELVKTHKFDELLEFCAKEKTKAPEWLTPYYYAALGYGCKHQTSEALAELTQFLDKAKGAPAYGKMPEQAEKMQQEILLKGLDCR